MWKTIDPIIVMRTSCLRRQLPRHIKWVDLFLVVDIFLNAKDWSEWDIHLQCNLWWQNSCLLQGCLWQCEYLKPFLVEVGLRAQNRIWNFRVPPGHKQLHNNVFFPCCLAFTTMWPQAPAQ
jgi:hypothetical protein